jgi:hypothetical protein
MKTKTLNGILCKHDIPIEDGTCNYNVLFLHNESDPLANIISWFSNGKKIRLDYFLSDEYQTEEQCLMGELFGHVDATIESEGQPYSEVTSDICWEHENEFKIGGHDMNRELSGHVGKWILIRMKRDVG